jgi:CheY-like chemotaxis protein
VKKIEIEQMSKHILIADDDHRNRKLLETLLRADGYLVMAVDSGQAVLDSVACERPDLILLDLMMPGMDGFEVVRRLKGDVDTQSIPIVMVTALDDSGSRLRLLAAGVADLLTKPLDRWQLRERLEQLLGANS